MSRTRLHKGKRWFSIEHGFFSHPKTVAVGEEAAYLFLAGIDYCGERLTDGKIPKGMVPRLTTKRHWKALADRLCAVLVEGKGPYWYDRGDHYEVHEYLVRYPSKAKVEADLEKDRRRKGSGGESRRTRDGTRLDSVRNPDGGDLEEGRIEGEVEEELPRRPPRGGEWPGFDAFWDAYPWHVGKAAARKAWERLRPDATLQTTLLAAVAWQRERGCLAPRTASDGRPVQLHAATWLNGRRWEDEPAVRRDPEPDGDYVTILGRGKVPFDEAKAKGWL